MGQDIVCILNRPEMSREDVALSENKLHVCLEPLFSSPASDLTTLIEKNELAVLD